MKKLSIAKHVGLVSLLVLSGGVIAASNPHVTKTVKKSVHTIVKYIYITVTPTPTSSPILSTKSLVSPSVTISPLQTVQPTLKK